MYICVYFLIISCQGGELFDQIASLDGDHYTEEDSCHVIHQIAKGVKYMHECGIVHRDLKPENILCVYPKSIKRVKIADFGISKIFSNDQKEDINMRTKVGTLNYMAPEIFKQKGYNEKVDDWSVGVIMYILLCGYPPFWGDTDKEVIVYDHIMFGEVLFDEEDWQHVSSDIVNLVRGLLERNPRQRKTTDDILNLTWKVSSTKKAFKMAQNKFKETVVRRKLHRSSMGVFESDSKTLGKFYKDDKPEQSTPVAMDRKRQAFLGKRGSKTEEFLELTLPIETRDSIDFK
ncbi:hypothetical protein RFI_10997 [Reticulomyxa filosa]|uniref:Protein kinase domain-containing protein n=1 Tax=Reticulomyxa filosa TaxID=46433 RepID=X6NJP2_RETFI|nr:hypothetical protein RFI_10997 [Reticulomyxa filosa]|eukprot:ETO26138.1 hypothetical protein RFI_10997 [Reticulomyxa filosa]